MSASATGAAAAAVDSVAALERAALYVNRELSLLEFQQRVLEEAKDPRNPLLERVKFLAIFGSNLDEFFMVRVSGIRRKVEAGILDPSPDGLTPEEEVFAIREFAGALQAAARKHLNHKLLPKLRRQGIHVHDYRELGTWKRERADASFRETVYPVLVPMIIDDEHPLPHLANLSLNLALVVRDPDGREGLGWVQVPDSLPRLHHIARARKDGPGSRTVARHEHFVWLEQLVAANLAMLFPGLEVVSSHPFRVVRDADIAIHEAEAEDLMEALPRDVGQRRFGSVIQVAVPADLPDSVRRCLQRDLEVEPSELVEMQNPLGLSSLWQLYNDAGWDHLKYAPYHPFIPKAFRGATSGDDIFAAIRQGNILLHHPYDSFDPVVDFLRAAARDPQVVSIKQTLYRVGHRSPVVEALLDAAARGRQVAVLVELNARFEEESNIGWARRLEQEGAHLVYGVAGLKTHSKIAMVERREGAVLRRYLHLATGNYNAATARLYEDIGMFTCDEAMGADAADLFDYLARQVPRREFRKLLVAPTVLRERLEALIERECAHARAGRDALLVMKVNSLVDPRMIRQLFLASQAGVRVELLVRGICCLRPGIEGISENIRVSSLVGQYLEHSRIFYFLNGGAEEIYLGSADLMQRNLNRRVEVVFPVEDPSQLGYLRDHVLGACLQESGKVREMMSTGQYRLLERSRRADQRSAQDTLMALRTGRNQEPRPGLRAAMAAAGAEPGRSFGQVRRESP